MAIKIACDGCDHAVPLHPKNPEHDDLCPGCRRGHDGHAVGRLDPVVFCDECHGEWVKHEQADQAERVKAVKHFEAWRQKARQALRKKLAKLPDDWDG